MYMLLQSICMGIPRNILMYTKRRKIKTSIDEPNQTIFTITQEKHTLQNN